ncbi:hypothetical protein V502_06344 [Pseudogymnoascus sp. VKM F-4520 (FW-2644)]|nr:hypothetical protein V502_06344 [Pseudogymnoascus sp. VKM F-4520 (FW-2644)]
MPTYEESYKALFKACEEFVRLYDPRGTELELIRFRLNNYYGEITQKDEGTQTEEGTQKDEGTQTDEGTQKLAETQKNGGLDETSGSSQ